MLTKTIGLGQGSRCEPGGDPTVLGGDLQCTGLILLAFMGRGHDHIHGERYQETIAKGLDWLLAQQREDGSFPTPHMHQHAIATAALAEAYAMTLDNKLREPASKALDYISSQDMDGLWKGSQLSDRFDLETTAWCLLALQYGRMGDLEVLGSWQARQRWEDIWQAANEAAGLKALDAKKDRSIYPRVMISTEGLATQYLGIQPGDLSSNGAGTAIGLITGVILGQGHGKLRMETLANEVLQSHLPSYGDFTSTNQLWLFFNTNGMFQMGGKRWQQFYSQVLKPLVTSQRNDKGAFHGSWDWDLPGNNHRDKELGRLLSTAHMVRTLIIFSIMFPTWKQRISLHGW